MRIDGYYWVKHPRYGWHVGRVNHGNWFLPVGDMSARYKDHDFDQISSRIKNPDEEAMA
jgi:hypothetical protein